MKKYKVKNTSAVVVRVYDSAGKGYLLKPGESCEIDRKVSGAGLLVEEVETVRTTRKRGEIE